MVSRRADVNQGYSIFTLLMSRCLEFRVYAARGRGNPETFKR